MRLCSRFRMAWRDSASSPESFESLPSPAFGAAPSESLLSFIKTSSSRSREEGTAPACGRSTPSNWKGGTARVAAPICSEGTESCEPRDASLVRSCSRDDSRSPLPSHPVLALLICCGEQSRREDPHLLC